MKHFILGIAALTLLTTGSGCCCLANLFGHGCGYQQQSFQPYAAPAPACGSCGYGPQAVPYGPTGMAPAGTTAFVPTIAPTYAAINTVPVY